MNTKKMSYREVILMTDVESALLSMWCQFAYKSEKGHLWCGGLSALEEAESILRARGLIKGNGQPYKNRKYELVESL